MLCSTVLCWAVSADQCCAVLRCAALYYVLCCAVLRCAAVLCCAVRCSDAAACEQPVTSMPDANGQALPCQSGSLAQRLRNGEESQTGDGTRTVSAAKAGGHLPPSLSSPAPLRLLSLLFPQQCRARYLWRCSTRRRGRPPLSEGDGTKEKVGAAVCVFLLRPAFPSSFLSPLAFSPLLLPSCSRGCLFSLLFYVLFCFVQGALCGGQAGFSP